MDTPESLIARACLDAYVALPKGGGKPQKRSNGRYGLSTHIGMNGLFLQAAFLKHILPSSLSLHWAQASNAHRMSEYHHTVMY